jgi:hypothetical protein
MFYIAEFSDISIFSLLSEKERNGTLVQHLYIAIGTALEIFPVPSERSGMLSTMMGTPLEQCDFSS